MKKIVISIKEISEDNCHVELLTDNSKKFTERETEIYNFLFSSISDYLKLTFNNKKNLSNEGEKPVEGNNENDK